MQTSEAQKPRLAPPQPGSDHPPQVPRLADCSLKGVSAKFTDRWGSDVGINPATREHEGRTIEPLPVGQHEVSPRLSDDDLFAVELDLDVHVEAYHAKKGAI